MTLLERLRADPMPLATLLGIELVSAEPDRIVEVEWAPTSTNVGDSRPLNSSARRRVRAGSWARPWRNLS